jgi:threonine dehydratase
MSPEAAGRPFTPSPLPPPTLADVSAARRALAGRLSPTPLVRFPALCRALGCEAYLKLENLQPIGVFKVRGGLYLMSRLGAAERAAGVITASTGNHGQSVAYAAREYGIRAIVAVPRGANPLKVEAIRALEAEVVPIGRDFDEAREWAEAEAGAKGYRYVHPANEPDIVAGVGTISLEILEALPQVEAILVPVGGGSCLAGQAVVAKSMKPTVRLIGVQAEGAPAVTLSWRARRIIETPAADTFAEGLQTRVPFLLTLGLILQHADEMVLVSDAEIRQAMLLLLETARQVAEGAGAAPVAAALRLREQLAGKTVCLVLSGGNVALDALRHLLCDGAP